MAGCSLRQHGRRAVVRPTGRHSPRRAVSRRLFTLGLVGLLLLQSSQALAHQPYFEGDDLTPENALAVAEPTISTALYATLDRPDDVDYFVFTGVAGSRVELGMTIPQIPGQEEFAPTIGLIGPGLPGANGEALPADEARELIGPGEGLLLLPATPASSFYEPFSRTSYWRRQREKITLTADGRYVVAVWSPDSRVGRYVLVVGDREIPGGDPMFALKLPSYWTPVTADGQPDAATAPRQPDPTPACNWWQRIFSTLTGDRAEGCGARK